MRCRIWWRTCAKVLIVIAGLSLFLGLEYLTARTIGEGQWIYLVALYVVVICLAAIIARPTVAFVAWLAVSPIAGLYLQMRKFEDLPQLTFDRLVIYSLALVLLGRALVRKGKPRKLILPELLFLAFPVYVLLSIPFFPHPAPQRAMLDFMQRAGDPLVVYLIARSVITERKHVAWVLGALFAVGVYSAPMAFYDHFTGHMSIAAISGISASLLYSDAGGRAAGPLWVR